MPTRINFLSDINRLENMSDALLDAARGATEIHIATAFLTVAGAKTLLGLRSVMPKRVSKNGMYVVVGLWQSFTEPMALALLHGEGVNLYVASTDGFHIKHYTFFDGHEVVSFTGSSNVTAKGLSGSGELVVRISAAINTSCAQEALDVSRRLRDERGLHVDSKFIQEYKALWQHAQDKRGRIEGLSPTKLLLTLKQRNTKQALPSNEVKRSILWLPVWDELSHRAIQTVVQRADWQGSGPTLRDSENIVGLSVKGAYDKVMEGHTNVWVLNMTQVGGNRQIYQGVVCGKACFNCPGQGRYWYYIEQTGRRREVNTALQQWLREEGYVTSWRPLVSHERMLSQRKAMKLNNRFATRS